MLQNIVQGIQPATQGQGASLQSESASATESEKQEGTELGGVTPWNTPRQESYKVI